MCRKDIAYCNKDLPHWCSETELQAKHFPWDMWGTGRQAELIRLQNSQFGKDGGAWSFLLLTPKICQVLKIDRLDSVLCTLYWNMIRQMLKAYRFLSDQLQYQVISPPPTLPSSRKKSVFLGACGGQDSHVWTSQEYTGQLNLKASLESDI